MASILIPIADALVSYNKKIFDTRFVNKNCLKAKQNHISSTYLLLPITLSTSYAFMLPVATPTNAVVYGSGYLTIKDMVNILE